MIMSGAIFKLAYNGQGLCEGRASRYKSSSLAQCLIIVQKFNKPTNTLLLQNPCYGQYGF